MTNDAQGAKSNEIAHYDHIVLGAGPAGVIASETLAQNGAKNILLLGGEEEPPYSRMAIPYLLVKNIDEHGTYLRKEKNHFTNLGIKWKIGKAVKLDEQNKTISLTNGEKIGFGKLCIATGSHPVKPPIAGLDHSKVQHCWTLEDARNIAEHTKPGARLVLMGAGFIGCIILEALAASKADLTVIEMGDRMVPRMLDETSGGLIKEWCEAKGVHVHVSTKITNVEDKNNSLSISLDKGSDLEADLLVVAAGVAPNIAFLKDSSLKIGNGIRVNAHMQTSNPDIYAAGDVAEAMDFSTHEWNVHAIQPVAADHGRIAGLNMLGKTSNYKGSMGLNVLDTLGLISTSFGKWDGIENGDSAVRLDREKYRYTRLEFDGDALIGAQTLGRTNHVGVIRGLIENKIKLGSWKDRLMADPNLLMDAYVDLVAS